MKDIHIGVSKAPEDPEKHKEWANQMLRIQVAMWVDGKSKCQHCNKIYKSVDDWIKRRPKKGYGDIMEDSFVDEKCWVDYVRKNKGRKK